jgi:hypothetical protein
MLIKCCTPRGIQLVHINSRVLVPSCSNDIVWYHQMDVIVALSSNNGSTMSPHSLLGSTKENGSVEEHTRISHVSVVTAVMYYVVSKYLCELVLIFVSDVRLMRRSLLWPWLVTGWLCHLGHYYSVDTASMCSVVSKYLCGSVPISTSEIWLIRMSLADVVLN